MLKLASPQQFVLSLEIVIAVIIVITVLVNWTTLIKRLKFRRPTGLRLPEGSSAQQAQFELQEPYFRAEIVSKEQAYRRGEHIVFRSRFTGWLFHGFFANIIAAPEIIEEQGIALHRLFSNTTPNISDNGRYTRSWPEETLSTWSGQGRLHGEINTNWISWEWEIPTDCQVGKYKVKMSVWNIIENRKEPFITYEDDFNVIDTPEKERRGKDEEELVKKLGSRRYIDSRSENAAEEPTKSGGAKV